MCADTTWVYRMLSFIELCCVMYLLVRVAWVTNKLRWLEKQKVLPQLPINARDEEILDDLTATRSPTFIKRRSKK